MRISALLLIIIFSGCMVGPDYRTPEVAMPSKFIESKEEVDGGDLCLWWEQFEDPFLNQLIEEAYVANFDVRIAMEQILEARAKYKVQRSQLWPEIDLNATAIRSRSSQNVFGSTTDATVGAVDTVSTTTSGFGAFGPPVQNLFQVGFDAIWELDFFGKFRRAKRASFFEWEASKDSAQNVLIIALSEVARDYVAICALQQKIEIAQEKIWADEELLKLTQELFEAGLSSEIQVEDLVATLESDRAVLPLLEASFKQTVYSLAVLLGRQPESLLEDFEEIRPIPSGWGKIPVGLPADLLRRRPDVRQAERQLAAATERVGVAVADLFPHISLTGTNVGYEAMKGNKWFQPPSRYWTIGPSINWDVLDFGKTRGFIDASKSVQRQALLLYEKAILSSLQDVEGALAAYFEEEKRQLSIQEQYGADERAFVLTQDLFEAGLSSDLQVLQTLRVLLDAENVFVDSQQSLTRDLIAVYKALGGDWECSYSP
jgi:NodT family efflux transporter outer membrane factor (OMF) lipoprotein